MKQLIKSTLIILLTLSYGSLHAQIQGQLFASAKQPEQTDILQYSTYSFVNLKPEKMKQENNFTGLNYGGGDRKVHVGGIMAALGILTAVTGGVVMDNACGGNLGTWLTNTSTSGEVKDWKEYNTGRNIALVGLGLAVTGIVIAAAQGDMHNSGNGAYRGPAPYRGSSSGWLFSGRHHHEHWHRGGGGHGHHGGGGHRSHSSHPRGHR